MVEVGQGGTEQARFEREVIWDTIAHRLDQLHLGDATLVFGRIDRRPERRGRRRPSTSAGSRCPTSDQEPRRRRLAGARSPSPSTGPPAAQPMGLARRRHFATRGRTLLGIEDELFGEGADLLGGELAVSRRRHPRHAATAP